jgi:hypothetical protein
MIGRKWPLPKLKKDGKAFYVLDVGSSFVT